MFLQGFINENLEPVVENIFLIGKEENIPLNAILDTGFNGMFCMPRGLAPYCELISLGLETFELADGTLVEEERRPIRPETMERVKRLKGRHWY